MSEMTTDMQPAELARMDFDAMLTDEEVSELESVSQSWSRNRRAALAVLSQSKAQMMAQFWQSETPGEHADTLLDLVEHLTAYQSHLDGLREQAESARSRLLVALSAMQATGRLD